jgi:hypothetical protein
MSCVSTWVLARDGKFYKDPVLRGEDWFLCFDDDDPPELVIKSEKYEQPRKLMQRAEEILRELGLNYELISKRPTWSGRDFLGTFLVPDIHHAGAVFLKIKDPIPVPREYEAVLDDLDKDPHEKVYYDFGRGRKCPPIK